MLKSIGLKIMQLMSSPVGYAVRRELRNFHNNKDIGSYQQQKALQETAEYVQTHMAVIDSVTTPHELLTKAWGSVDRPGLVLEFGVFSGRSINHIATLTNETIYGFDSFEGLPERWRDGFGAGFFKVSHLPDVLPNVELIKGWFEETLPKFVREKSNFVSFLHVDCDLYSSTKTIFNYLSTQIGPGTVIVFDEYFNYPGWQEGEIKAFREFLAVTGLKYEYIGYNRLHEQVAVKICK